MTGKECTESRTNKGQGQPLPELLLLMGPSLTLPFPSLASIEYHRRKAGWKPLPLQTIVRNGRKGQNSPSKRPDGLLNVPSSLEWGGGG